MVVDERAPSVAVANALSRAFYARSACLVARELLGCILVRRLPPGDGPGTLAAGRIVETEAYVGEDDRACHAHRGRTSRNAVMYGRPGHAYVYFIYGMYDMMNVVCAAPGVPEAVLLRALEPVRGLDAMQARRGALRSADLASGPGKLCRALEITRALNGTDLRASPLWIVSGGLKPGERIRTTPRIGVDYAGEDALRPLRFLLDGNACVSRPLARPRDPRAISDSRPRSRVPRGDAAGADPPHPRRARPRPRAR